MQPNNLRLIENDGNGKWDDENEMEKTNFSCDLVFPQQACFVVHRQEGGKPFDLVYLLLFDVSPLIIIIGSSYRDDESEKLKKSYN